MILKIKEMTKKNPSWCKVFELWVDSKRMIELDIIELERSFSVFVENKAALKNTITIEFAKSLLKTNSKNIVEDFDDEIQKQLHIHKKSQFIKSISTSKYEHLFSEEVEQEIHILLDNKISTTVLKRQFFVKIARFYTHYDLLDALQEFREKNIIWSKADVLDKIKKTDINSEIMSNDNNTLMVQVKDFSACSSLGSQAWCITQQDSIFKMYIDNINRQYIFMDFNLPVEDHRSMIGLTVNPMGNITAAHFKDDSLVSLEDKQKFIFDKITLNNFLMLTQDMTNHERFRVIIKDKLSGFLEYICEQDGVHLNYNRNVALNIAIQNNDEKLFLKLIKKLKASKETLICDIKDHCKLQGNGDGCKFIESLVLKEPNNSFYKQVLAIFYIKTGKFKALEGIIKSVNFHENGNMLLNFIKENKNVHMIKMLARNSDSIDVSAVFKDILHYAISHKGSDYIEILECLFVNSTKEKYMVDKYDLWFAMGHNNLQVISFVIENYDIGLSDVIEDLLAWAIKENHYDFIVDRLRDKRLVKKISRDWIKENTKGTKYQGVFKKYAY